MMRLRIMVADLVRRSLRRAFSVPIFVKILGIGFLVTVLFGVVAFYQIRVGMFRTHYQVHGETALAIATSLAGRLEPLIRANNKAGIDRELNETIAAFPDVRYIVIQDPGERILSHGFTFPKEAPPDLLKHGGDLCAACHATLAPTDVPGDLLEVKPNLALPAGHVRAYSRRGGLILEVLEPIGDGVLGTVRLGVGDKVIAREIASISRSLFWSLALCLVVGLSLALALAFVLVKPIHNLVQTTNRLREGDFQARADVFSDDEIGRLAVAFNQMAAGLEAYRREVQEKEAARVSLIGQIVQAQEEERKSVARELHDQLGQSLSTTLLTLESLCRDRPDLSEQCEPFKQSIRDTIDEVRRLAWLARPAVLDDYGLDVALRSYVDEMLKRVEFPIDYQCVAAPHADRLPNRIEVTLYRIAQEAVTNIIRHAHPTQASIILLRHDQEVNLIIEDNGCGFDAAAVDRGAGRPLGIIGMKERAALVGGEFVMSSAPGKGASLRVRIPLSEGNDAHSSLDRR